MKVAKWGNSLAIRLPAPVVTSLALKEGDEVDLEITTGGTLAVTKAKTREEKIARLQELMRKALPEGYKFDREDAEFAVNFLDTNIVVYAADPGDSNRAVAAQLIAAGGFVSVQVLNEMANVLRNKKRLDWVETVEALQLVIDLLEVAPMSLEMHQFAVTLARRYGVHIYDANILAAALIAGCDTLYSEDMQNGLLVEGRLRIVNPFA